MIDKPALMNAIWDAAPEYAYLMNWQEQSGKNDLFSALLAEIGMDVEPNIAMENMIPLFPDAGKDFLLLKGRVKAQHHGYRSKDRERLCLEHRVKEYYQETNC